jgi:hypothetical protein
MAHANLDTHVHPSSLASFTKHCLLRSTAFANIEMHITCEAIPIVACFPLEGGAPLAHERVGVKLNTVAFASFSLQS